MRRVVAVLLFPALLLAGCGNEQPPAGGADNPGAPAMVLDRLLDEHFEGVLEFDPVFATRLGVDRYNDRYPNSIGPEYRAAMHDFETGTLERLLAIDRDALDAERQTSYDVLRFRLETSIAGERFPDHLAPMNQFSSAAASFIRLGSGSGTHPFDTVRNYEEFLGRVDGFVVYVDQAIANMRDGIGQGVTQPRILMEKFLPQLESQLVERAEDSGFYAPVTNMPESFPAADRERIAASYRAAIEDRILPAFRRLHGFVADEYVGAARESVGLLDLPDGKAWYAHKVRSYTTTDMGPDEIHQVGLDEIARIHDEIRGVIAAIGFEGDLAEFFEYVYSDPEYFFDEREALIAAYRDMSADIQARVPALFTTFPKTPFEVRPVEPFREQTASKGSYQRGSPDGSRPGIFYANTYKVETRPKWDMKSLFLHEAIPGHHFQLSLMQENGALPDLRRYTSFTAYTEGWGLYAEHLGRELGAYENPMDLFGALNAELWRSIRLVSDTGIHAKGWTRQQVLDFMHANAAVSESRAVQEAERFMAYPGQALAYKTGQLKMLQIRRDVQRRLGDRFDVRAFHAELLDGGALPLKLLEARMDRWVTAQL